jgi:hypothetical protein
VVLGQKKLEIQNTNCENYKTAEKNTVSCKLEVTNIIIEIALCCGEEKQILAMLSTSAKIISMLYGDELKLRINHNSFIHFFLLQQKVLDNFAIDYPLIAVYRKSIKHYFGV